MKLNFILVICLIQIGSIGFAMDSVDKSSSHDSNPVENIHCLYCLLAKQSLPLWMRYSGAICLDACLTFVEFITSSWNDLIKLGMIS